MVIVTEKRFNDLQVQFYKRLFRIGKENILNYSPILDRGLKPGLVVTKSVPGNLRGVVTNVPNFLIAVSEFELLR